jgi:hypothetical protein
MISDELIKEIVDSVLTAQSQDITGNKKVYDKAAKKAIHDYEELHKVVVVENETR